jgi:Cu-processing system permease protein
MSTGIVARYVMLECVRRRVFLIVPILTAGYLALYWFGSTQVFESAQGFEGAIDADLFAGATMLGLSMFATLFLGAVLATFLTFTVVRGDADQGLLQPLVVRPLGRTSFLIGRLLGASLLAATYVLLLFSASVLITGITGGYWPDRFMEPALQLAGATVFVALLSVLGSVFLTTITNGVTVLMLFGAGLVSGLLGQIGEALNSDTLVSISRAASTILPFEALYQAGLRALTADVTGPAAFVVQLGPFGGGVDASPALYGWLMGYFVLLLGTALIAFDRRDV